MSFSVAPGELTFLLIAAAGAVVQVAGFLLIGVLSRIPAPVNRLRAPERAFLVLVLLPASLGLVAAFVLVTRPLEWPVFVPLGSIAVWLLSLGLLLVPLLAVLRQRKIGWGGPPVSLAGYLALLAVVALLAVAARTHEARLFSRELRDYAESLGKTAATVRRAAASPGDPVASELDEEASRARAELTREALRDGFPSAVASLRQRRALVEDRLAGRTDRRLEAAPAPAEEESAAAPARRRRRSGGCAQLNEGMTAAEVQRLLGPPDEVRSTADIRGPGSERFTYRDLACQVHLLDGVVEFVD